MFDGAKSKSDIVATFLAVLELTKTKRIMQIIIAEILPFSWRATLGIIAKITAAKGAPIRINGLRLPIRVWHLSEILPNVGWKITPKMLSNVIIIPMKRGTEK